MPKLTVKQKAQVEELKNILPEYTIVESWDHCVNSWAVLQLTYNSDNPRPMLIELDPYLAVKRIVINPPMLRQWGEEAQEGKRERAFNLCALDFSD